ncbi:MAG: ABC transporter permease, partial [Clostridia bacterium]
SPKPETAVLNEFRQIPSITRAEGLLEAPAEITHNWHKKELLITGLNQASRLFTLYDENGQRLDLPDYGIILSSDLAQELDAEVGSRLTVKSAWAKRDDLTLTVSAIVPAGLSATAYMEIHALQHLLGQSRMITSVILAGDPDVLPQLFAKYHDQGAILGMDNTQQQITNLFALLDSYQYFIWIMLGFAAVTGFAIVYNTSIISLAERQREFASLRVLGMTSKEVLSVITLEQWFIAVFAILCGLPVSLMLKYPLVKSMDTGLFNVPLGIPASSYTISLLFTVAAVLMAHRAIARRINSLSMIDVLKDRE